MFWTRLLSSIILTAATICLVILGGLPLLLAVAVISIIGLFELYRVIGIHKTGLAYMCYILAAIYEAMIYTSGLSLLSAYIFIAMLGILLLFVFSFPKYKFIDVAGAFFGLFYVVFMLSFVFLVRILEGGKYLVWFIFLCAWGSDTLAYCTGMLIGKHKMSPVLSPKKSIEGAIGGIIGAAILCVIYTLIFKDQITIFKYPLVSVAIIGAVSAAISIVGDLAASAIKRHYDIKDYSGLIPGHGGILDRFDSIIITAPIVFFLIMFLSVGLL